MILSFTTMVNKYNMDIKGIIHIGAHHGQEIEEYIDNGVQDIIMFEPVAYNFQVLEEKMSDLNANIQAYQVALGNEKKENVLMYLSDNNLISSSVLKPKVHLQLHPGVGFPGREEVEMDRLDNFAEETAKFNFINMDVMRVMHLLKTWMSSLLNMIWKELKLIGQELFGEMLFIFVRNDYKL